MKVYIYGLIDPRDGQIRYVGQTRQTVAKRVASHVREAVNYHSLPSYLWSRKNAWVVQLIAEGSTPEVVVLQESDEESAAADEKTWIGRLIDEGALLLNCMGTPDVSGHFTGRLLDKPESARWRQVPPLPPPPPLPMKRDDIRGRRERLGLSQSELARALGYTGSSVSLWESGKRTPPPGLSVLFDRLEREMSGG